MVVSEGAINNIMGGMENTAGVRLHSHRHKLKQRFDIIRKLGQGTYGKVQLAINKETGQEVAIKTIKKAKIETEQDLIRIRREIQIMSSVQHPHIIHIYEVFENREKMVLVMEYAAGGELYDYLSERKVLKEEEARRVFRQVSSAAYYCHKHKICHRDLKLENILLDIEGNAKIADFGLSNVFAESHRLDTFCGSPLYASPEIVKGIPYVGPEVDCWSLGVLLYTLVYGAMPFDGSNFRRLVKQITQGDFYEPQTPSPASDLIRHMLAVSAEERANVEDICSHWWVNEGYPSCLDEAETLANQTPVRLDLLLSLAPKHINSEHMLIQPEDEDSQRSESSRADPKMTVPSTSADTPSTESMATRSLSMGAMPPTSTANHSEMNEIDQILEKKRQERKNAEDKKRQIEDSPSVESKKKKEDTASLKEDSDRKKSPRDSSDRERKRSVRKKEGSVEKDTSEKDKKKTIKKRDSSANRELKERKKASKKKEEVPVQKSAEEDPPFFSVTTPREFSSGPSEQDNVTKEVDLKVEAVSQRSTSPTTSTDATLKASDSSISRVSVSPSKDVSEPTSHLSVKKERKLKGHRDPLAKTDSLKNSSKDISKDVSMASIKSEDSSKPSLSKPSPAPSKRHLASDNLSDVDTDKILQETAEKIERVEAAMKEESEKQKIEKPTKLALPNKKLDRQDSLKVSQTPTTPTTPTTPVSESERKLSFKDSTRDSSLNRSVESSQGTTPDRSRTGSESSSENRPSRAEVASRRQSKIFSKAAMFDQMLSNNASTPDKPKKITRPGGLNMSDLAKKFEEKAPVEKKKVITTFKTSDVRNRFESDNSESSSPMRKASAGSSGDSMPSSPSRTDKPAVANTTVLSPTTSLSATAKPKPVSVTPSPEEMPLSKKENVTGVKPAVIPSKKEKSPTTEAAKVVKEKSPVKDKENTQPKRSLLAKHRELSPKKDEKPKLYQPKIITKMEPKVTTVNTKVESKLTKPEVSRQSSVAAAKAAALRRVALAAETSDSSDSESEAERVLKFLAQKRERLERAKEEKLRLNFEAAKNREAAKREVSTVKDEVKKVSPVKLKTSAAPETNDATKFATLPKGFKTKADSTISKPVGGRSISADEPTSIEGGRKKTEMAIVLNNQSASSSQVNKPDSRRSSYTEIKIASPAPKTKPQQEFKTEVRHSVSAAEPLTHLARSSPSMSPGPMSFSKSESQQNFSESQLQRARRERIIPIMLEEEDEEGEKPTTRAPSVASTLTDVRNFPSRNSSVSSVTSGPSRASNFAPTPVGFSKGIIGNGATASPENIRKSKRERIIPISVEGEGYISPIPSESNFGKFHQSFGRNKSFGLDKSESFSSAGEDDDDEEEDGFQILTAESLFSTLLSRVRSLTRKMTAEEGRGGRRVPLHPPPNMPGAPGGAGFWSSLYSAPGESPARRISETLSRSSLSRDEDPAGFGGLWSRTTSRDPSDAESVFSDPSSPFNTMPRGGFLRHSFHMHQQPSLLNDPFFTRT